MRRLHVDDLVYQVATLVLSFLVVHVPYTLWVRPNAQAILADLRPVMVLRTGWASRAGPPVRHQPSLTVPRRLAGSSRALSRRQTSFTSSGV